MPLLSFFGAPNVSATDLVEVAPWDYHPPEDALDKVRSKEKGKRRKDMLKPGTEWQVYSAVKGLNPSVIISGENPATALRGLVIDFDTQQTVEMVHHFLKQESETFHPNFIEVSLSGNIRLVWVFEREINVPDTAFASAFINAAVRKMHIRDMANGYDDAANAKPTMRWTNGGEWHKFKEAPLPWELVFGIACDVSKALDFGQSAIPIDIIAAQVEKLFPGRWTGEFVIGALGVRFWDAAGDCETGAQIKPDGMLCFTGRVPFVRWNEILGAAWCNEQRALHIGRAAGETYFDGHTYWHCTAGLWVSMNREDAILRLRTKGISTVKGKGQACSDADKVLEHIQETNRIKGASPLINYPPGMVSLDGERILNTVTAVALAAAPTLDPVPERDFPWIWKFLNGFFARPELNAVMYFHSWMQRAYRVRLDYSTGAAAMGQALFLCGPKNNGKTLLCSRIIKPLLGNKERNPFSHLVGKSDFNDDLFDSPLWAINDEESPGNEADKQRMNARLKGYIVNSYHTYHPKFCKRLNIPWVGRIVVTLNDDAESVGILPEINDNTYDKLMFFASRAYDGAWPNPAEVDVILARELPFYAAWLLRRFIVPGGICTDGRIGIKSFFDPHILALSKQQSYAWNFFETLQMWARETLDEDTDKVFEANPSELAARLDPCDQIKSVMRGVKVSVIAKSLITLAKAKSTGITNIGDRHFRFDKQQILAKQ